MKPAAGAAAPGQGLPSFRLNPAASPPSVKAIAIAVTAPARIAGQATGACGSSPTTTVTSDAMIASSRRG